MRHTQIFIRAEVLNPLVTLERANFFMRDAVAVAGMSVISGPHSVIGVVPGNEGVSSTVILDFSSASLHEWHLATPMPIIHFDLYTCGDLPDEEDFRDLFIEWCDAVRFNIKVVDRDVLLGL